ncbi:MAG: hypothetical protein LBG80_07925 [Bacteroidales bacterium]|nr:hypothetical protein [Bacteroidales bacterium]
MRRRKLFDYTFGIFYVIVILTCHPYGILLTANIFSTDISSLRDFQSMPSFIRDNVNLRNYDPKRSGEQRS